MSKHENVLRLDLEQRCCLGVCAGFARYLDVAPTVIRVIYCVSCLIWPTLIAVYFIMYWILKEDDGKGKLKNLLYESQTLDHFRQLDYKRPLYRNPHNKKIAGVCSGIADYLDISPGIVRLLTLLSFFLFGPFTFWAYIIGWMVIAERPKGYTYKQQEQMQAEKAAQNHASLQECASTLQQAENRLRAVEAFMTSKQFRLHCEINRI
ncbi:MAG: envelope stress response membrane protein PspC [Pseudomonadales bacterium]|nr:envelope stress response membrane protein PspC [Pseudomonadales bacterium]